MIYRVRLDLPHWTGGGGLFLIRNVGSISNSEFEFCALECIMQMDKVTGCAKLYSEFRIAVVRFADEFQKL